jgi:hypothetical protein
MTKTKTKEVNKKKLNKMKHDFFGFFFIQLYIDEI